MELSLQKISAFVITKNEEPSIGECLSSISFLDDIVVVDDFSSDGTEEICRSFNNVRFYRNRFDSFSSQKSFALSLTKYDWVLEIDADERVSEEMKDSIIALSKEDFFRYNCFFFRRRNFFGGRWIRHGGFYPDYKGRLYNKLKGRWSLGRVHERFVTDPPWKKLKGDILHYQTGHLRSYLLKQLRYAELGALDLHDRGVRARWYHYTLRPLYTFIYRYLIRLGFLDGFYGFELAVIGAIATWAKYSFLKALEKNF
ncbi:MAG: glycosyltransferase family 2 protein [Syntrophobacterales bacterium]|nr:glycosyltransferase family 2 protein [Syntrophobacterales bacterium]